MDEAEMIEGCKKGDRVAQHKLYKFYASKMFAVCFRYASDRMDAEDILQEGFVKVFNGISKYLPIGPFGAWIKTIMINTAIQHYRRNKRSIIDNVEYVPDTNASQPSVVDSMSVTEVLDLIKKLPDGYRQIFNLYAVEGYKHYEIGEMLGISEGTSKSQYARAKKSLQEMIEPKQRMIEQKQSNG